MHKARKRFGQNFLHDNFVIRKIIAAIAPEPTDNMVEIGPGKGALTLPLLEKLDKLQAIELDRDLIPNLEKFIPQGLVIHAADALAFDFSQLSIDRTLRIVGNLPYNISTPLIFHLLSTADKIIDMHFMLQKEVVDRMVAQPNTEHYGRLSVMVQYYCEAQHLFDVAPGAFTPQPKVESSIVRLKPYNTIPHQALAPTLFYDVVKLAFSQRRKTLRNCLKTLMDDALWRKSSINPQSRAEQLAIRDFVELANLLYKE